MLETNVAQKKIETVTKSIFNIPSDAAEEDHIGAEAAAPRFFPADGANGSSALHKSHASQEIMMALHEFEVQLVTLLPQNEDLGARPDA